MELTLTEQQRDVFRALHHHGQLVSSHRGFVTRTNGVRFDSALVESVIGNQWARRSGREVALTELGKEFWRQRREES